MLIVFLRNLQGPFFFLNESFKLIIKIKLMIDFTSANMIVKLHKHACTNV